MTAIENMKIFTDSLTRCNIMNN